MTPEEAQGRIEERRTKQSELRGELIDTLTAWSPGEDPTKSRELFGEILRLETDIDQLKMHLPNFGEDAES